MRKISNKNRLRLILHKDSPNAIHAFLNRATPYDENTEKLVKDILHSVRLNGDQAVRDFTKKFDGANIRDFRVSERAINAAYRSANKLFLSILEEAAANIERFHKNELEKSFFYDDGDGVMLGQKISPIERALLYAPGGKASYPSSVLMNAIPAKVAGVEEIYLTSPCNATGELKSEILLAATVAGIKNVYRIGGAQAIAAFAFGTETLPKVDKITGPGNRFVALAKRFVFGTVGIDSIAGPSEITIIADETAEPEEVVMDLFSQAEHDTDASAVLITPSKKLAYTVQKLVETLLPKMPRADVISEAINKHSAIILTESIEDAVIISNQLAPEHLEIQTHDPWALLPFIKHAGAVFLGRASSEPVGDYFAGPNHTLPTSGTARFFSALSVRDFQKRTSIIAYTNKRLERTGPLIAEFAEREGLFAHAGAIRARLKKTGSASSSEKNKAKGKRA
ncbi:MAG: histidinol dehydrogenase [Chloroherpetonaceae bacterium]|nr:histidinol dehydrogenase [Chloroherpetonaceae bacterium]